MKKNNNRKLICQVTGKQLFAGKQYYEKKITKAGSEDILHKTYICREAKILFKKGYSIDDVRQTIDIHNDFVCTLTDEDIKEMVGISSSLRINTNDQPVVGVIKTDPAVTKFLNKIL